MTPEIFREYRNAIGVGQAELAKILQCDRKTLQRWEKGEKEIPHYAERFTPLVLLIATDDRYAGLRDMIDLPDPLASRTVTPVMEAALAAAIEHGSLIRTASGYWSAPSVPCIGGIPRWYFVDATIQDLIDAKVVLVQGREADKGHPARVILKTRKED